MTQINRTAGLIKQPAVFTNCVSCVCQQSWSQNTPNINLVQWLQQLEFDCNWTALFNDLWKLAYYFYYYLKRLLMRFHCVEEGVRIIIIMSRP